jgi:biopolymer transport protein ExbD
MKLPRNARIFQGQLDVAPFAGVFFLLLMFILFSSSFLYTPGIQIDLPEVDNPLPGTTHPSLVVSIDSSGRIYHENQVTTEKELLLHLRKEVEDSPEPLMLILQADKNTTLGTLFNIMNLARNAGVQHTQLASEPHNFLFRTNRLASP